MSRNANGKRTLKTECLGKLALTIEADINYVMRWIVQVNANKTLTYIPNNIASLAQRVLAHQKETPCPSSVNS